MQAWNKRYLVVLSDNHQYVHAQDLINIPDCRFVIPQVLSWSDRHLEVPVELFFQLWKMKQELSIIVIWPTCFERYRQIVMSARLLGVYGQIQKEQGVIHIIAKRLYDESDKLESLSHTTDDLDFLASADEVRKPGPDPYSESVLPKGRNFH